MKRRAGRDWVAFDLYVALMAWIVPVGLFAGWSVWEITGLDPLSVWIGGAVLLGGGLWLSLSHHSDEAAASDPTPPAPDPGIWYPGVTLPGVPDVFWIPPDVPPALPDGVRITFNGQFRTLIAILRGGPAVWLGRRPVPLQCRYSFRLAAVYVAILWIGSWFLIFWLLVATYA